MLIGRIAFILFTQKISYLIGLKNIFNGIFLEESNGLKFQIISKIIQFFRNIQFPHIQLKIQQSRIHNIQEQINKIYIFILIGLTKQFIQQTKNNTNTNKIYPFFHFFSFYLLFYNKDFVNTAMNNIIESLLVKYLGSYIDGLKNSLDIGLFDGEVSIQNVSLKPSFINQLGLPFTLQFSHIEKIHIHIPWTSLKDKNTIVTIKGIYVLLNISYEQLQHEINAQEIFKAMIQGIKAQMKKKWIQPSSKQQSFAEKNLIRIVDNLILNINNIHIRMQSFQRHWDYSIGIIMDDITSYTVDENQQKVFYHRSFSKKQNNLPFKKILNIDTLQIYFNDDQKVFLSNLSQHSKTYFLKMMAHPFRNKPQQVISTGKKHPADEIKYPHYQLKIFTNICMKAIGTQRFSQDLRYLVDVDVEINTIDFKINSKQLSQLIYCMQHFYQYALNILKNGRKGYDFNEQIQKQYTNLILKIAKEQKFSSLDRQQLINIIREVPTSLLQRLNIQIINAYRFELEIKKISKVSNVEKSKKMMQELQQKKKKMQAMEGVEIFQEVVIQTRINKITLGLLGKSNNLIMQLGMIGLSINLTMNLEGLIVIRLQILNMYILCSGKDTTKDHFNQNLNMLALQLQMNKQQITILNFQMLKKQILITQQILLSLLELIQMIRIRPALLNYIDEQMNYSIDITRVMMRFLIQKNRDISIKINLPILNILLNHNQIAIKVDLGCLEGKVIDNYTKFKFQFIQPIDIYLNSKLSINLQKGNSIIMITSDKITQFQNIIINLTQINIKDPLQIIKVLLILLTKNQFIIKYQQLSLIDHISQQQLDGHFYLNKLKPMFKVKINRYQLQFKVMDQVGVFIEQNISLIRSRIYKLKHGDRFYIVFKEEVNKEVNIIEVANQKMMKTIYSKLKEKIHQISTSFQWQKYYKSVDKEQIENLQSIQDTHLQNATLMKLQINLNLFTLNIYTGVQLELSAFHSEISYNQFNTQAALLFNKLDLQVQSEKIIYDLSFKGTYQFLQTMQIQLQIPRTNFQIKYFKTIEKMISVISFYQVTYFELQSSHKRVVYQTIQEDDRRLQGIKSQNSRTDNINKFLLQKKIKMLLENIEGMVIGYRTKLSYIKFDLQKYRNQRYVRFQTHFRSILIFSMVQIPSIIFNFKPSFLELKLELINIQLIMDTIIYQIVKGQGSVILKSVIQAVRNRKIAKKQYQNAQRHINQNAQRHINQNEDITSSHQNQQTSPSQIKKLHISIKIDEIRFQIRLTDQLKIGMNMKDLQLQNNKFLWNHTLFWLNNDCLSLAQNNGILKWYQNNIDLCMTDFKLKLNSKEIIFLVFELKKIYVFFKNNRFDVIQFVQQQFFQPDKKGRIIQRQMKIFSIRIQQLELIYQCTDKHPLLSIRFRPLFLTNSTKYNTINLSIWNLNRLLKLYQPIIQPTELKIIKKDGQGQHLQLILDNLLIIITQQFIIDCLNEAKLLSQLYVQLSKNQSNQFEEMNIQQIQLNKQHILQQQFTYYQECIFKPSIEYSFQLKINNYLTCQTIIEVSCNRKNKQQLTFERAEIKQGQSKIIYISQKTSYNYSYQLIERYQKVHLKICMLGNYHSRTATLQFLLYDQDNYYIQNIELIDSNGMQINSTIAVKVTYSQGIYLLDIISTYTLENCLNYSLYFRYADQYSINKFILASSQIIRLSPWTVDYVTFGLKENQYNHVLMLRSNEGEETSGFFQLAIKNKEDQKLCLVLHKEKTVHKKKEKPELHYLKQKTNQQVVIEQFQTARKVHDKSIKQQNLKQQQRQACIFTYKIIPGILIINHINFPISINNHSFEYNQSQQLFFVYLDGEKQYIKLTLGDHSYHQIYIPKVNQPLQVNLKVKDDNFVTVIINVRKNRLKQRIIHIYSEIHLLMNFPNLLQPAVITNIYQNNFIVKKQIKNQYSDKIHPSPCLKDKFIFNTSHYLLSLQQKYISLRLLGDKISNEIIMYDSDFNKDLIFKNKNETILQESVFSVSYFSNFIYLENDQDNMKIEHIETYYTYIMPKFYLINRSQGTFYVNGHILFRNGQKITVQNIRYLDMNVRDQMDYKYIPKNLNQTPYMLFIKGQQNIHSSQGIDMINQVEINKKVNHINASFLNKFQAPLLRNITQISQGSVNQITQQIRNSVNTSITQNNAVQQQLQQQSMINNAKHLIKMQSLYIFAVSKRLCEYNTICYEIQDWTQWLQTKNELIFPIIMRTKITEDIMGIQTVQPGQTSSIISGLCDFIEISIIIQEGKQVIIGPFSLNERLNHIFLLQKTQIHLNQNKVKSGRFMIISSPKQQFQNNINKVSTYFSLKIHRINISLILFQQKIRKQFLRININDVRLLLMKYKTGLYMTNITLQILQLMFRRLTLLLVKELKVYIQGIERQFMERLQIETKNEIEICLNDQLIVCLFAKFQELYKRVPNNINMLNQEGISQEQKTFHLNSLKISPMLIKFSLRKIISDMNPNKAKLLSKLSLSIVQIQDAKIELSPVLIETPIKQKHINGINKMYTMESFIGIASGLNILGNVAQFSNQFQAGRNRSGVLPFFRSLIAGTSNSVSKIIGTIGSSVSQLTFDRQFMKQRIQNKNIRVQGFGMGLKIGLREIAHSVKSCIKGLVEQPMQGYRQDGTEGALKGTVAGLTGLITKPLTGLILASSKIIQGINSSTTFLDYKIIQQQQLIGRPLYHKFKLARPYKSQEELGFNILINWYNYIDVQLVSAYLLQNQQGDSIVQILIITCSELILIDLQSKEIKLKLRIQQLMATGKFTEGVVLYYQNGSSIQDQDEVVFRLQNSAQNKQNLYWTLKGFINLYFQQQQ